MIRHLEGPPISLVVTCSFVLVALCAVTLSEVSFSHVLNIERFVLFAVDVLIVIEDSSLGQFQVVLQFRGDECDLVVVPGLWRVGRMPLQLLWDCKASLEYRLHSLVTGVEYVEVTQEDHVLCPRVFLSSAVREELR